MTLRTGLILGTLALVAIGVGLRLTAPQPEPIVAAPDLGTPFNEFAMTG